MDFALSAEQTDHRDRAHAAAERLAHGYQARERAGRIEPELRRELGAAGLIAPELLGADTAEAAMCKWWAPKVAYDVVGQCLLLHGQYGYRTELPIEQRLRDVLGLQIGDGTAQIMKLVISRQKLGREFAP